MHASLSVFSFNAAALFNIPLAVHTNEILWNHIVHVYVYMDIWVYDKRDGECKSRAEFVTVRLLGKLHTISIN